MGAPKRLVNRQPRSPYVVHLETIYKAAYAYHANSTPNNNPEAQAAHQALHEALLVPVQSLEAKQCTRINN